MKAKTFLDIHNALLNNQKLAYGYRETEMGLFNGLCGFLINDELLRNNSIFELFIPTTLEIIKNKADYSYWFDSIDEKGILKGTRYNEMRQNVILLCAAINGEL